jgi:hypothetical protein
MAYLSDRIVSLNKLIIAAAVAYAGFVSLAHAESLTDQMNRNFASITAASKAAVESCKDSDDVIHIRQIFAVQQLGFGGFKQNVDAQRANEDWTNRVVNKLHEMACK